MANEKFKFNPFILFINLTIIWITIAIIFIDKFNLTLNTNSMPIFKYQLIINFNKFIISNIRIIIIIIIYLLIVIIAVVKISNFKSGPLRQKF